MGSFARAYSSAITGWDLNHKTEPHLVNGIQVEEKFLDYVFASKVNSQERPKKHENNPDDENKVNTRSVLNFINQVLLNDELENKSCMIENSTLEAAEKSFYEVLSDDLSDKYNTICSNCSLNNSSNDLFDIVSDLQKYKSSICFCNTDLKRIENFGSKLVRRRSFKSEEIDYEQGRSNKHMAVCPEESALHEMFDNVLSLYGKKKKTQILSEPSPNEGNARKGLSKREAVDLRNLLTQCMKYLAGSNNDNTSSSIKLLKQIRYRACVSGDGTERLAHYFANGLEARLDGGIDLPVHKKHALKSGDVIWKAFKLYLTAFPFMETSYFFANQMIMTLAGKKETSTLHIIHFGIMQGLQWPSFIQSLSKRPGGPPKLRITGIDFPQEGFRADVMIEGTKNRLVSICKRFNVPFEYNGFVKNWDTITLEDFKIKNGEVVVVNCLYHMMYLLDDTVVEHSPRDVVLRLIKRVNPNLFVHVVVNGAYNSPFLMSRFREALFHYSTLFDMFDVNLPRENPLRMVFEREIWGREITNILACEGTERIERPETYKQWQLRSIRAGFKQIPLNQEIVKQVRNRLKTCYHKDFFMDEVGHWLLDGWKGRAIFALSCWESEKPTV